MTKRCTSWNSRALWLTFGAVLLLPLSGVLSGCGAEAQTPVEAPTGTVPGGGSADEYDKKMKEMQTQSGGAMAPK